ncbi:hypothetical protein ACWCPD_38800 [Streptomyces sp. NPDC001935]
MYGGFRRLVAARPGDRLAVLTAGTRPPRPHRYDSHPPDCERITRIEELATDGRSDGSDGPLALTLLRDTEPLFMALEARLLPAGASQLPRMSGENLVMACAVADAEGWSRPLRVAVNRALRSSEEPTAPHTYAQVADGETLVRQGGPAAQSNASALPGLDELLNAFDRGLLWMDIADRMPKPPQAARLTGPSARNFIRPKIFDGLAGMVHLHLVRDGHAVPDQAGRDSQDWPCRNSGRTVWTTPSTLPWPTHPTQHCCAPCWPAVKAPPCDCRSPPTPSRECKSNGGSEDHGKDVK